MTFYIWASILSQWVILSDSFLACELELENIFFCVNGIVTKLECFCHINAGMTQSVLCNFERRFGLDTVSKQQTSSKRVNVGLFIA